MSTPCWFWCSVNSWGNHFPSLNTTKNWRLRWMVEWSTVANSSTVWLRFFSICSQNVQSDRSSLSCHISKTGVSRSEFCEPTLDICGRQGFHYCIRHWCLLPLRLLKYPWWNLKSVTYRMCSSDTTMFKHVSLPYCSLLTDIAPHTDTEWTFLHSVSLTTLE